MDNEIRPGGGSLAWTPIGQPPPRSRRIGRVLRPPATPRSWARGPRALELPVEGSLPLPRRLGRRLRAPAPSAGAPPQGGESLAEPGRAWQSPAGWPEGSTTKLGRGSPSSSPPPPPPPGSPPLLPRATTRGGGGADVRGFPHVRPEVVPAERETPRLPNPSTRSPPSGGFLRQLPET